MCKYLGKKETGGQNLPALNSSLLLLHSFNFVPLRNTMGWFGFQGPKKPLDLLGFLLRHCPACDLVSRFTLSPKKSARTCKDSQGTVIAKKSHRGRGFAGLFIGSR